jgi:hypothetical protein
MNALHRLRTKLCRELAQSEHDAKLHCVREAKRLGEVPPAEALRAIATHANDLAPRLRWLMSADQPIGLGLGRAVASAFSSLRHYLFDRLIDAERSYRGTLLGLKHGLDVARLLRAVAHREGRLPLAQFCNELLAERRTLIDDAERALDWFAERPAFAVQSGLHLALATEEPSALRAP